MTERELDMDKLKLIKNLNLDLSNNITQPGCYSHLEWDGVISESVKLLPAFEGVIALVLDRDGDVLTVSYEEGKILLSSSLEARSNECKCFIRSVNNKKISFLLFVADEKNFYSSISNEEIFLMREEVIER